MHALFGFRIGSENDEDGEFKFLAAAVDTLFVITMPYDRSSTWKCKSCACENLPEHSWCFQCKKPWWQRPWASTARTQLLGGTPAKGAGKGAKQPSPAQKLRADRKEAASAVRQGYIRLSFGVQVPMDSSAAAIETWPEHWRDEFRTQLAAIKSNAAGGQQQLSSYLEVASVAPGRAAASTASDLRPAAWRSSLHEVGSQLVRHYFQAEEAIRHRRRESAKRTTAILPSARRGHRARGELAAAAKLPGQQTLLFSPPPLPEQWSVPPKGGSAFIDLSKDCLLYTSPSPRD